MNKEVECKYGISIKMIVKNYCGNVYRAFLREHEVYILILLLHFTFVNLN